MTLRLDANRDTQAQPSTLALGLGSNDTVQDMERDMKLGRALLPYDAPIPAMAGLTGFSSVTYQSTMKCRKLRLLTS